MKAITLIKSCLITVFVLTLISAGSALAASDGFDFIAPDQGIVSPAGSFNAFHTTITNTGSASDTYHIVIAATLPENWISSLCAGSVCYDPEVTEIDVPAGAGEVIYLDIDVISNANLGRGDAVITVTSNRNPSLTETKTFTTITKGLDILLVDADTDDNMTVAYYTDALTTSDKTYAVWNRSLCGALATNEMEGFSSLLWVAGTTSPGLTDDDRNALVNYLQLGGMATFSGQNLAYDVADPASPNFSAGGTSFLQAILGVGYANNNTGGTGLDGVLGDVVTQGKTFVLGGGSGMDMNTSPDGLVAVGSGATSLTYSPGAEAAAVASTYGLGKTYFMGFGMENIASATGRSDLLISILAWFDGATPAFGIADALLVSSLHAAPNPFNPQTSIKFEVGGVESARAEIVIFDLRGHVVRNLFKGEVAPGSQNMIWNGRNDHGQSLATGLYMARVQVGQDSEVVKMTLAK